MKKLVVLMGVLLIGTMACGTASAALLGIKASYEGISPDIDFNNAGVIDYASNSGLFYLQAIDNKLFLPDGTLYTLSVLPGGPITKLTLRIYVDSSGNLTGGYEGYDMIEKVTEGSVTIDGVTYNAGDVLLQADVSAFGWRYNGGGLVPSFDFLLDTASGGLVTQGIWPSPSPLTALWVETNATDYSWASDFHLIRAKGDKMVTPEPTSMLLLGVGLIGLAGRVRKRFKA